MSKWLEALVMTRPPKLLHALLPGCEWTATPTVASTPVIYLTFDDGPIPDETPWVLEQLAQFEARATFFCVGDNVAHYPAIARAALAAGHRLGNHTYHHVSAWKAAPAEYLTEVQQGQQVLAETAFTSTDNAPPLPLFRPPYGRLTRSLIRELTPDYRIIMWSVLTRDYDPGLAPEKCLRLALAAIRPGDIVVFHDSRKASARLRYVLPRLLAHFAERGFRFETL
jgi:peptidoglycan/xylan/chitin deacetylase (PgdA/CDA1 family)